MDTLTTATTGRRKPLKIYSWLRNLLVKERLKGIAFTTSFGIMVAGSSLPSWTRHLERISKSTRSQCHLASDRDSR